MLRSARNLQNERTTQFSTKDDSLNSRSGISVLGFFIRVYRAAQICQDDGRTHCPCRSCCVRQSRRKKDDAVIYQDEDTNDESSQIIEDEESNMSLHRKVCSAVRNLLRSPDRATHEPQPQPQPNPTPSCTPLAREKYVVSRNLLVRRQVGK